MNKITGAGIIIYYDNRLGKYKELPSDILYLFLKTKPMKTSNTERKIRLDFPKGSIDKNIDGKGNNENPLDCAVRETLEECGLVKNTHYFIDHNKFINSDRGLVMYLGEFVPKDKHSFDDFIKILPNPESGYIEHIGHFWGIKEDSDDLLSFLKKYIEWADINIR